MKRLLFFFCTGLLLFSCVSERKEVETILALDEEHSMVKNGVSLVPILNEVRSGELKINSETQKGTALTLELNITLEEDEEIHYSINNGKIERSKDRSINLELLDGNNVVFICLSNTVGVSSSFLIKNYFVGEGQGDFDRTQPHLFQNFTVLDSGVVIDYQILNAEGGYSAVVKTDSSEIALELNKSYLLKNSDKIRLLLMNDVGESVIGPFSDTGVMDFELQED